MKQRDHLGELGIDGMTILKCTLEKWAGSNGLDLSGTGQPWWWGNFLTS
jgi:hypothetical protein